MFEFRGMGLMVGRRNGHTNLYRLIWPKDLVPELGEFLKVWRPLLPEEARPELFIALQGKQNGSFELNKPFPFQW